jgi:hypothetical protein
MYHCSPSRSLDQPFPQVLRCMQCAIMLLWAESPQLLSLKRICSYWIHKSCFWAWIRCRYVESGLWLLSCFWAWIRSRYFESGLWLLSCFWAWIRSRYFESGLWLFILFLSTNPKSLSRIRSVSLIFFCAPIFEFRNQYPVLTRNSFNLGLRDVLVLLVLSRHGCPSLAVS